MFSEQNNLLITRTELDDVLFEAFDAPDIFPGRASAKTASIFKVIDTTHSQYIEAVNQGVGLFKTTQEFQNIAVSVPQVGGKFIVPIETYTNSIYISKQLFDDNMHGVWQRDVKDMAKKFIISQDINAFSLFRGAFTTTLCWNGSPLIAAGYPILNGGTETNLVTGALSNTSLQAAIVRLAQQKDQAGVVMGNTPRVLLVPTTLFDTAVRVTNSVLSAGSANNDVNVYLSVYGLAVYSSPYIDAVSGGSDTAWFLLSDNHTVTRYIRQGLNTALTDWTFSDNLSYRYQANFREGYAAISQVGVVASLG